MNSLGTELKTARAKQNISLRQVADETRISFRHLESLEEGRYDQLPGGVYNRVFLRSYGEFLGLDTKSLLALYDAETEPPSDKLKPKPPQAAEIKRGIPPIALWSAMLLLTAGGLFLGRHQLASVFSSYFSRPGARQPEVPKPEVTGSSVAPKTPSETPAPVPKSPAPAQTQPADAPSTSTPGKIRIQFQVVERCWVSAECDGKRVLRKELEPGESPTIDAARNIYMVVGNAGGVRLILNGKPAKSLGGSGRVVRLQINEQNLQDFLAQETGR